MLFSLAFRKRKPKPPPTFQPEDLLGLKTIPTLNLDEIVPTKDLRLVTRTSRLALTISMCSSTTMTRRGCCEKWKKHPRDFPRLLTTLLPAPTANGRVLRSSRASRSMERTITADRRTVVRDFGKKEYEYLQVTRENGRLKLQMVVVDMESLFPAAPRLLQTEEKKTIATKEKEVIIDNADHRNEAKKSKLSRRRSSSMSSLLSDALKAEEEGESSSNGAKEDSGGKGKKSVNGGEERRVEEMREPRVVFSSSLPERPSAMAAARNMMLQQEGGFRFGEPLQIGGMSRMRAVKT